MKPATIIRKPLLFGVLALLFSSAMIQAANAEDDEQSTPAAVDVIAIKQQAEYSDEGADTCLQCHDEDSAFPVMSIFKTPHGVKDGGITPMAQLQCETCHGPSGEHSKKRLRRGETREPMIDFKTGNNIPSGEKNSICASCHQSVEKQHWKASIHQINDVACTDCHKIHVNNDPVSHASMQVDVCGQCHQSEKMAANRFSTHPIQYDDMMGCTSCHAPHGSPNDKLLVNESTNETCFQCHTEKRGPFLWEHQPATEDCALCHAPHGSNHDGMLTLKKPTLCQTCHSSQGHPSLAQDNSVIDDPISPSTAFILARSCTNCHAQVHGSNHPSGYKLQK